jgi:hypothetical protein
MDVTFEKIEIEVDFGLLSLNLVCLCLICPLVVYHRVIIVSSAVLAIATTLSSSELRLRSSERHRSLVVLLRLRISLHSCRIFHSDQAVKSVTVTSSKEARWGFSMAAIRSGVLCRPDLRI